MKVEVNFVFRGTVLPVRQRSLNAVAQELIDLLGMLTGRGVEFLSLSENIDTTTAGGRLVFHVMAALAEFERALIGERTHEGLAVARRRGVRIGRRKALHGSRLAHARERIGAGERPENVALSLQVGRSTLYRALRAEY